MYRNVSSENKMVKNYEITADFIQIKLFNFEFNLSMAKLDYDYVDLILLVFKLVN